MCRGSTIPGNSVIYFYIRTFQDLENGIGKNSFAFIITGSLHSLKQKYGEICSWPSKNSH